MNRPFQPSDRVEFLSCHAGFEQSPIPGILCLHMSPDATVGATVYLAETRSLNLFTVAE
jgi:hypothetical protein